MRPGEEEQFTGLCVVCISIHIVDCNNNNNNNSFYLYSAFQGPKDALQSRVTNKQKTAQQ